MLIKGNQTPKPHDVMIATHEHLTTHDMLLRTIYYHALILDEAYYVKNPRAERSKRVYRLARHGPSLKLVLLLSGTPVLNRPSELLHPLDVLEYLPYFGGKQAFLHRYCDPYHNGYGWDFSGSSHLDELNDRLRSLCYLRRTKAEVLHDLPPKRRAVVLVPCTAMKEYGRGINFQLSVDQIDPLLRGLQDTGHPLLLAPTDQWYRRGAVFIGQREFLVLDPDGYLLRFAEPLGTRSLGRT